MPATPPPRSGPPSRAPSGASSGASSGAPSGASPGASSRTRSPLDGTTRLLVDGTNLLYRIGRVRAAPPAAVIGRLRAAVPGTVTIDLVFDGVGHGVFGRVA